MQTFLHTLDLARAGRNEEALLGCDFILKMDLRFLPARQLLDSLRGVSSGTLVELAPFDNLVKPQKAAPAAPAAPARPAAPEPIVPPMPDLEFDVPPLPPIDSTFGAAPPESPSSPFEPFAPVAPTPQAVPAAAAPPAAPPEPPPVVPKSLDDLGFDSFGGVNPFDARATQAFRPADALPPADLFATPPSLPPVEPPTPPDPFSTPASIPAVARPSAPDPFATPPSTPVLAGPAAPAFGGFGEDLGGDPFAGMGPGEPPPGLSDFTFGTPPPEEAQTPAARPAPPAAPPPASAGAPAPSSTADPRVVQFLKQGDDAMARGQIQEAIDLWSRVFLIDLSNEEASRRIDSAREKQAQTAQAIDVLLSEGIQLFDARDLVSARSKFLDVLALSESEPTARNYLNQIESALSLSEASASSFSGTGTDFLNDSSPASSLPAGSGPDLLSRPASAEAGQRGGDDASTEAVADEEESGPERKKVIRLDVRVLAAAALAVLCLVGGGVYLAMRGKPAAPPPLPVQKPGAAAPRPVGEDLIAKAQALFNQGRADEALQILVSIPDSDPRHREALSLIDRFKSSAVPAPPTAAPSAASVDEMRVSGFAAMAANRYIEAVKALDPVVKARPDDTEAAQALTKAREHLSALASAVRSYNEQDYESAIKLLWDLRKKDLKNQDVEEFLFKSYFNEGVQDLQAGNARKAAQSFQEAVALRPQDAEAARHLKFAKKYTAGTNDILSRIYVKNAAPRP